MGSIIKENISAYIMDKRKILLLMIYTFFCGTELSKAQAANMSLYEYVLFVMSNHYYIIYFMFMAYIFFMFDNISKDTELVRIRIKTVKSQYIIRTVTIMIQSIICVSVHFILAYAIGITRLEASDRFCVTGIDGYYNETVEYLLEYSRHFVSPLQACICTAVYMTAGLTFIGVVIYVIDSLFKRKVSLIAIGLIILNIMTGFKMEVNGAQELVFINNYFIMHHALLGSGKLYVFLNVCVEAVFVYIAGWLYIRRMTNKSSARKRSDDYVKEIYKSTYICSIIFLAGYIVLNSVSANDPEDVVYMNLVGYSNEIFYIFEFVRYVIFFMIPIFFMGVITQREKKMFNAQAAIRYGRRRWQALLKRGMRRYIITYCIIYVFFLILIAVALQAVTFNGDYISFADELVKYMNIQKDELLQMAFAAIVIKICEFILCESIYACVYDLTGNSVISYIIVCVCFIPSVISGGLHVSFGASSLYNIAVKVGEYGFNISVLMTLAVLTVKIIIVKLLKFNMMKIKWRKLQ